MDLTARNSINNTNDVRSTTNREGLLEELADRSIATKDDQPQTNVTETFWRPPWAERHPHEATKNQTRAQSRHCYSDQHQDRSGKSEKWLQKSPLNVGSQKNDSCLRTARGKAEKWLQKSSLNTGSQKNDSCLKTARGKVSKMASEIPVQRRKSEKWLLPQDRSGGSQQNGFRNSRSTQEVRKRTLTSSRSGEVRKMISEIPLNAGSSKKNSYQPTTQQVQLCQVPMPFHYKNKY
ncbi:hypothetical protein LR48_Vigan03g067700 [Vigna angularis]|uniref:Uncharacterized protein n=1 Tax=Phaseolus angularis TaxID=3914 RepID=A0A0L9U3E1_PHAAN|nr:hypothetical protein LR48_Vigan03g067700 [Vigna angularis]